MLTRFVCTDIKLVFNDDNNTKKNLIYFTILQTFEENIGEVGALSLIIHGTNEMPAHMRNGPRSYNPNYSYQMFKYFGNVDQNEGDVVAADTVTADEAVAAVPGDHRNEDDDYINSVDSSMLAEVEKELQRIHHRKVFNVA